MKRYILKNSKDECRRIVAVYFFTYAAIGSLFPLIGQYLRSIGFIGVQIGIVTSSATVPGMAASVFWGMVFHRDYRSKGQLTLAVLCGMAALTSACILSWRGFAAVMVFYMIMAFFQIPVMPLTDALVMETGQPLGAKRKWGTAGFALSVFFAGRMVNYFGISIIFIIYCASFAVSAGIIYIEAKTRALPPRMKKVKIVSVRKQQGTKITIREEALQASIFSLEVTT